MGEIAKIAANGFTATSTFSGCGGSSLGYRLAGFRVAWASEFVPAAADTYRANAPAYTLLDTRDIREVTGREILTAIGLDVGELDLWDGSPPCASFSTAGAREAGWGKIRKYSDVEQRTDDLFFEYARLIKEVQPRTFVAENVAGLIKGAAKGYFKVIVKALRDAGYEVAACKLDASRLGVPQVRNRIILLGVRNDLPALPAAGYPDPLPYVYTAADAIGHDHTAWPTYTGPIAHDPETGRKITLDPGSRVALEWARCKPGENSRRYFQKHRCHPDKPVPCMTTRPDDNFHWGEGRSFTLGELRRLGGFPDDFALTGTYAQRWERIGRAVPPPMMAAVAAGVRDKILMPLREQGHI